MKLLKVLLISVIIFTLFFSLSERAMAMNLFKSAAYGRIDKVKTLIKEGSDLNAISDSENWIHEWTPLMYAATNDSNNNLKIAEILLENGADINLSAENGNTPLMIAWKNCFDAGS